ncbi:MAG: aminotransferase class V-fold PLP-dependent enzyme, partial [Bacteriovoracaceae bacterium]|nr:aminotransferase class V-fold PLP-dependent enzyme [Bacteriovoracaceae bacterium]
MQRLYFDYNATAPLAHSVVHYLKNDLIPFGNPASLHTEGRESRKIINEVSDYLFHLFGLSPKEFDLIYHSGATEGINLIVQGYAKTQKNFTYIYAGTDHSTSRNLADYFIQQKKSVIKLPVNNQGEIDFSKLPKSDASTLLNFLVINNETGVYHPLSIAEKIKAETGAFIHVDAVQMVGKIENWQKLSPHLDSYTFSGHKFGALKGTGFSFIKKNISLEPLFYGGGQQRGVRPGTQNPLGAMTLKLALEEWSEKINPSECYEAREWLEDELLKKYAQKIMIAGKNAKRASNTTALILKGVASDVATA